MLNRKPTKKKHDATVRVRKAVQDEAEDGRKGFRPSVGLSAAGVVVKLGMRVLWYVAQMTKSDDDECRVPAESLSGRS